MEWESPELIISQFAGEPTLNFQGIFILPIVSYKMVALSIQIYIMLLKRRKNDQGI